MDKSPDQRSVATSSTLTSDTEICKIEQSETADPAKPVNPEDPDGPSTEDRSWKKERKKQTGLPDPILDLHPRAYHYVYEAVVLFYTLLCLHPPVRSKPSLLTNLKVSQALELLCSECFLEIRYNTRNNVTAVDTRNGQRSRALLSFCGMVVRAHEPLFRPDISAIIRYVDAELSDQDTTENFRSPQQQEARVRRLGKTPSVKLMFYEKTNS